jgi:hypothetical protein
LKQVTPFLLRNQGGVYNDAYLFALMFYSTLAEVVGLVGHAHVNCILSSDQRKLLLRFVSSQVGSILQGWACLCLLVSVCICLYAYMWCVCVCVWCVCKFGLASRFVVVVMCFCFV